jgi:hypothetical protein
MLVYPVAIMDKWLQTGNITKRKDNEQSTSANVSSGSKFVKSRLDCQTQDVTGKSQGKRKHDDNCISSSLCEVVIKNVQNHGV